MGIRFAASLLAAALTLGPPAFNEAFAQATVVHRPAAGAFDIGPRASVKHTYSVTLQSPEALHLRRLHTMRVLITDPNGRPVEGAAISVDGGMPVHGHGLPTLPRVAQSLGGGLYEIEGVGFSMDGWWQLRLAIGSPAGVDSVVFNLSV
jgi:YtkA-like protein